MKMLRKNSDQYSFPPPRLLGAVRQAASCFLPPYIPYTMKPAVRDNHKKDILSAFMSWWQKIREYEEKELIQIMNSGAPRPNGCGPFLFASPPSRQEPVICLVFHWALDRR